MYFQVMYSSKHCDHNLGIEADFNATMFNNLTSINLKQKKQTSRRGLMSVLKQI